jgi:arsenate reductase
LKENKIDHHIILYLKDPLCQKKLSIILKKLKMSPINLIRKNETIWKQIYAEISMNNEELLNAMILHPKLIQRPIVELENGAVITCLTENIKDLL